MSKRKRAVVIERSTTSSNDIEMLYKPRGESGDTQSEEDNLSTISERAANQGQGAADGLSTH